VHPDVLVQNANFTPMNMQSSTPRQRLFIGRILRVNYEKKSQPSRHGQCSYINRPANGFIAVVFRRLRQVLNVNLFSN
jgi:hypothetical protein